MIKRLFLIGFIAISSVNVTLGQTLKEFSEDQSAFLDELSTYLNASNKNIKPIYEQFAADLKASKYDEERFKKIRDISNIMLARKMRTNPYFKGFLNCLNIMSRKGMIDSQFDKWIFASTEYLNTLKRSQNRTFTRFLNFSTDLFEKNSLRYSKKGISWTSTTNNYVFGYKSGQPFITLDKLDLIGKRKKDSLIIKNTSGVYYPVTHIWNGTKGSVNWERAGLSDKVYCTFEDYKIITQKNNFIVDTVTFYHPTFFTEPVKGKFNDKVMINAGKNGSYPRFESFEKRLEVKNIGDKIQYVGGFRMEGGNVIGLGDELHRAEMFFYTKSDELALSTKANKFLIRKGERIIAQDVQASIYFEEDSIHHPSIDFRFDIKKRELLLTRTGNGNSQISFYNSYHQLEMDVKKIAWMIDSDKIEIGEIGLKSLSNLSKKASFESLSYFNDREYRSIQNIANYNPLSIIKIYSEKRNSRELDAHELAKKFNENLSLPAIKGLLNDLVEGGFIFYNADNEYVIVNEKAIHYAEASRKQRDYDVIKAVSTSKKTHGRLDLTNQELELVGVGSVVLSDSQLVAIRPAKQSLTFNWNRNMDFAGQIFAGYGIFWGKDFHFDYDEFNMSLDSVKRFQLRIPTGEKDKVGTDVLTPLTTLIEDMTALVEIDENDNKASLRNHQEYPRLNSLGTSKVYYSDKSTVGGAYKRDKFFFELTPFEFDSLDSFDPEDIKFEGKLVSAGIFPEFDEVLRVQKKDLSLGFTTETPSEGYTLYGDKGTYNQKIQLGNTGLRGKGDIQYLTSTINSKDILFLPNSMRAKANPFNIEQQEAPIEYPKVVGIDSEVDWRPYKDSMYIKSVDKNPFKIFDGSYQLEGKLTLTPGGLYGEGVLDWEEASLSSKNFKFRVFGVDADSSNLNIKTTGSKAFAFSTQNVKSELDFKNKMGSFKSNSDAINTSMPYTQYRTSMNEFVWDMNKKEIAFNSTNNKAIFLSIHPQQDSLQFTGSKANYNLETNLLKIEGVPFIESADAFIYPKEGLVDISANAQMKPLNDAVIIANTTNKYHTINKAVVTVEGKESYKATGGFYEYNVGKKEQEVKFSSILVTRGKKGKLTTKGEGTLAEGDDFLVDKKTAFKGNVKLNAENKELEFKGYAKILSNNIKNGHWFSISSKIDRKNVIIDYGDKTKNSSGQNLEAGIRVDRDSSQIYTLLLTPPYSKRDREVFKTKGILKYNDKKDEFYLGDSMKIMTGARRGNMIAFENKTGKVTAEGNYILGDKLKYIKLKAAGQTVAYHGKKEVEMNLAMGIGFIIPDKLLNLMIRDIESNNFDVPDVDYKAPYFKNALAEFIDNDKRLEKSYKDLAEFEKLFLPKETTNNYTLFFGQVPMVWDREVQSFLSKGDRLGLSYVKDKAINKRLKAHLEVRMTRQADEINIYIEAPSQDYYYFNYRNNILSVYSSNTNFNDAVLAMKKKEVSFKMDDDELYEIKLTGQGGVNYFLRRAKKGN